MLQRSLGMAFACDGIGRVGSLEQALVLSMSLLYRSLGCTAPHSP